MNLKKINNHLFLKTLFLVVFAFGVLFSSCAVKQGIKSIFEDQTTGLSGKSKSFKNAQNLMVQCQFSSELNAPKHKQEISKPEYKFLAKISTYFVLSTLDQDFPTEIFNQRISPDSPLPLFIKYRQLII